MVCASLRDRGEELLGQRRGLEAYAERGSTMGVPLLYPWANRLGGFVYSFADREVRLGDDVRTEEHGLPVHGLQAAVRDWAVVEARPDRVVAGRDVDLPGFPFPHRVEVAAELTGTTLAIATTVSATGEVPVPICFGYHPYLRLPAVPRGDWEIAAPVREHLLLDERSLPTGRAEPARGVDGPLGERTFDDLYTVDADGGPFVLAGGDRRLEVRFERGYPNAQIFAPPNDDVVCFEPMTAPTDALRRDPPAVAPGERFSARFTIAVRR